MTSVFLFAHQDDEIGVFHEIRAAVSRGESVVCVYLTNGAWAGRSPERRNIESLAALLGLGVQEANIFFFGSQLEIPDGGLVNNLESVRDHVVKTLKSYGHIEQLFVHAWEGGHHDHDAAHLVGVSIAQFFDVLDRTWQFPLYRAPAGRYWLTFAAPLQENGPVTRHRIAWGERISHLLFMAKYPSQLRVMIKLAPHLAWDHIVDGSQKLQRVNLARLQECPNACGLLYETWKLSSYGEFRRLTDPFIATILNGSNGQNLQADTGV